MCPRPLPHNPSGDPEGGALSGRRRKLCWREGDEKVVSLEDSKNYTSCNYQTKQFHCLTTPNQTIPLYNNTKPNNHIL